MALALGTVLAGCGLTQLSGSPDAQAPVVPVLAAAVTESRPALQARPAIALESLPERPTELVDRIRREFELPDTADESIDRELEWFAGHQEYLDRVFGRSERYLYHIVDELERRGMPTDLALLPIVESAFDPFAYSHGRASGLWQIIPGTGRRLGLKQNWWFDGRRDVVESTRAALDYLELLADQFNGDWLLAVAGYNSGEGNVARAIRRAEARGTPTDFWSIRRDLPVETRTYVPRLIAIRNLVADPEAHGVTLPAIANEPVFEAVDTGGQIDMALAAELAGLDIDALYALNPGVNRWATDPDGPHRLLVPVGQAPVLTAALADLGERDRMQWIRHEIGRGETLSGLALEYHTTESVLREVNGLAGNMIRAGQHLMIPQATATLSDYSLSLDERNERQQNRERSGQRVTHRVRAGESLWTISRRYDVNVRELASWNAMAPGDTLSVGKELVIWTDAESATLAQASAPSQIRRVDYVVRRGDSLSTIAGRFRVSVGKLLEWNSLSADKYLQPGQRLVMYVDVAEQSS